MLPANGEEGFVLDNGTCASVPPDYHVHTPLCKHAEGHVADYRAMAGRRGMREICFTDHMPDPSGYDPQHRMEPGQYAEYLQLVRPLQRDGSPSVLLGIEADFYDGCEGYVRSWLRNQPFDLVLGAVHYIGGWGFDNPSQMAAWERADVRGVWKEYFSLLGRMADTRLYDVVAHLDLPKKFGHRLDDDHMREWVQPVLDRIAAADMAIEINTSGLRRAVGEAYPSALILQLACERGVPICFGSDSHRPEEVGWAFDAAVQTALDAGYREHVLFRNRKRTARPLVHR